MAQEPNAILAISSTDRFITNAPGKVNQPVSNFLEAQFLNQIPYSNDFQITAPGALINGYIEKLIVSQIQIQYYLPTIIPGRNDRFVILVQDDPNVASVYTVYTFRLPYGFYTPTELAALLEVSLNVAVFGEPEPSEGVFTVIYTQGSTDFQTNIGFTILLDYDDRKIRIGTGTALPFDDILRRNIFKTYKLFGFNVKNTRLQDASTTQYSQVSPVFLYTPYIDFYSDSLTNYQSLKDSDSSTSKRKGLVSRVYLSGVGNPQFTTATGTTLGSEPFTLTYDLNSPKIIKWSPDTAVNSLDFQLRDCYGDLLFTVIPDGLTGEGEVFNTEWQMTLLCVEEQ